MERLYQLGLRLGSGGAATIYRHPEKDARAIKLFDRRPYIFPREAQFQFQLPAHPGICQCLGTVSYYNRMEKEEYLGLVFPRYHRLELPFAVPYGDARYVSKLRPIDALNLVGAIDWLLIAVHGAGIVHRDINQQNFMLSDENQVVLIDFSSAGWIGESANFIVGTRGYKAPEVFLGKPIDQRTDIFSLGVVLHEIITARNPLQYDEKGLSYFKETVDRLPQAPLRSLINRMTAVNKEDRFQNAAETYLAILKTIYRLKSKGGTAQRSA